MTDWLGVGITLGGVTVDTLVGLLLVTRLAGRASANETEAYLLDAKRSAPVRKALGEAVVRELPSWIGTFDPAVYAEANRASIIASIKGLMGGRPGKVPLPGANGGESGFTVSANEMEEFQLLSQTMGQQQAVSVLAGLRILKRHRGGRKSGAQERQDRPAQPSAQPGARALTPATIEALEAAGFKRAEAVPTPAEGSKPSEPVQEA